MTRLLNRLNRVVIHLKFLVLESVYRKQIYCSDLAWDWNTYDQVSDDNSRQEERNAGDVADVHTIPHGLDPLAAQDSEHDHEGVHEVCEVPPRQLTAREAVHMVCERGTDNDMSQIQAHYDIQQDNLCKTIAFNSASSHWT